MKVCTDSCIFGAWIANKIQQNAPELILDIGTGTGLLSLMIAQKSGAVIQAVEIDKNAFVQAKENFESSPWASRLRIFNGNIKSWTTSTKCDCIISNPPFYENDLLPNKNGKQHSKHSTKLKLAELIAVVSDFLEKDGFFGVMLPYSRAQYFERKAMESGLFTNDKLLVRQTMNHDYFRAMLILGRNSKSVQHAELSVKNINHEYSDEFVELLKDYYLYL